jgi:glutamyl-tRNA synthetase
LGNARTALLGSLQMRAQQGTFLLRIEDLDPDRSRPEYTQSLLADLAYLGLTWDSPPVFQSQRVQAYLEALHQLEKEEKVYPCFCSRAEIARAASAPHEDEGPRYPGTCAELTSLHRAERARTRAPSWRFRVPPGLTSFEDLACGHVTQDVAAKVGDFVLFRADGVASYQLAVVVDDIAHRMTHVLRGDDLLSSTPRQLLLYEALGAAPPAFAHVPLLKGEEGERLAKRRGGTTLQEFRERGVPARLLLAWLARSVGLEGPAPEHFRLDHLLPRPPEGAWHDLESLLA